MNEGMHKAGNSGRAGQSLTAMARLSLPFEPEDQQIAGNRAPSRNARVAAESDKREKRWSALLNAAESGPAQ
jgi:hypothetical protein